MPLNLPSGSTVQWGAGRRGFFCAAFDVLVSGTLTLETLTAFINYPRPVNLFHLHVLAGVVLANGLNYHTVQAARSQRPVFS